MLLVINIECTLKVPVKGWYNECNYQYMKVHLHHHPQLLSRQQKIIGCMCQNKLIIGSVSFNWSWSQTIATEFYFGLIYNNIAAAVDGWINTEQQPVFIVYPENITGMGSGFPYKCINELFYGRRANWYNTLCLVLKFHSNICNLYFLYDIQYNIYVYNNLYTAMLQNNALLCNQCKERLTQYSFSELSPVSYLYNHTFIWPSLHPAKYTCKHLCMWIDIYPYSTSTTVAPAKGLLYQMFQLPYDTLLQWQLTYQTSIQQTKVGKNHTRQQKKWGGTNRCQVCCQQT